MNVQKPNLQNLDTVPKNANRMKQATMHMLLV